MGGFVASGSADTEAGLQVRVVESGRNGAGRGVEVERRLEHGVEGAADVVAATVVVGTAVVAGA